jgi:hypothetical protein
MSESIDDYDRIPCIPMALLIDRILTCVFQKWLSAHFTFPSFAPPVPSPKRERLIDYRLIGRTLSQT